MGKSNHEELLGGAPEATSNKQTVEDNLLGRPHVPRNRSRPKPRRTPSRRRLPRSDSPSCSA